MLLHKRFTYFDHAGATPVSNFVLSKMADVSKSKLGTYANPSGIHQSGVYVKIKIQESRKIISDILNCRSEEIFFTSSGTESNNLALLGYLSQQPLRENDPQVNSKSIKTPSVIVTNTEHPSVLGPLQHLEQMRLINIIYLKVDQTGKVNPNDLREILKDVDSNIVLVSIMYANNETGRVQPVKEIGRIIEEHNLNIKKSIQGGESFNKFNKVIYHIDACQAPNYLDIDTKKLKVDMMSLNSSKIYGPKGAALLFKKGNINIQPIIFGGDQEGGLRSGTENLLGIVGFASALQECQDIINNNPSSDKVKPARSKSEVERLIMLQDYFFYNIKREIPQVKIYTQQNNINKIISKKEKTTSVENKINFFNIQSLPNNINIGLPGISSDEMVIRLDALGFAVSHKSACAASKVGEGSYILTAMGATEKESDENIRITMGRSTTLRDVTKLIKSIKEVYYKHAK